MYYSYELKSMRFLVIGLGSMGKRRVRNLQALGFNEILGFDLREDRRAEAQKKYNIEITDNVDKVDLKSIDALIISTPPDKHDYWIEYSIKNKKPVFVEASIVVDNLKRLSKLAKKQKVFICPSCTLRFHPAVKLIKSLVSKGKYGRVVNFSYHMGQYLPDWHPWEKLTDCYTSKKKTGGAREMVAFELTWLTDIVGYPKKVVGYCGKTIDLGIDIDDTYAFTLALDKAFGNMVIDVTSRYAIRNLILNLENAQITWRWDEGKVKIYNAKTKKWKTIELKTGKVEKGYNKNIIEDMYEDEMKVFIESVKGKKTFPNTIEDDLRILDILYKVESGVIRK